MYKQVKYITQNINNQQWELGKDIGHGFEDYIYKVITKKLSKRFSDQINIIRTPATGDGGRDIIIYSKKDIDLFGITLSLKGKKQICIYIECKSTNKDTVDYDKIAKNAMIAGQDQVDYFLLVTNKTLTPRTYYSVFENGNDRGYEFILIDQYILLTYLEQNSLNKWKCDSIENISSPIALSYQLWKGYFEGKTCFDLYLLCRNYSNELAECKLELATNWNWKLFSDGLSFVIEEKKGHCLKLKIFKEYADGDEDIELYLTHNNHLNTISISGDLLSYDFELPLAGENHKKIIGEIKETFVFLDSFLGINLYGEAGVGKTRIVNELVGSFLNNGARIINCICEKNQKSSTFVSILKKVSKYFKRKVSSANLQEMIYDVCDEDALLTTVILIEDIHNADKEFLEMLKTTLCEKELAVPVVLITTGRDDFTVYNEEYFSFLEVLNNSNKKNLFNYHVVPFKDDECINLIKRTIVDIPDEALERIHILSKNNPFYLVQYIEYLLEIKMVNLLNRNTVAIPNILTFSKNLYMPKGIEELLNDRYQVLSKFELGSKFQDFLVCAAFYGLQFPEKLIIEFFAENEYDSLETLLSRHFIISMDNDTFKFSHESIYLFFKNLKLKKQKQYAIYKSLYCNCEIYNLYNTLKKGVILYKLHKYAEAKKYFTIPIKEIERMDNISSDNISDKNYEYFDYIYNIFKIEKEKSLMKKTINAKCYVAMHNLSTGQAMQAFEEIWNWIEEDFSDDEKLAIEIKQLQASHYLHVGMISKARGIMNDLLAMERMDSNKFSDQTKYNLFERASSLYIHTNYMSPAIKYNKLSFNVAEKMQNDKLKALSKINEAKLYFFSDTQKSYNLMKEAKRYLSSAMVPRIDCHNELGILTAEIILETHMSEELNRYINKAQELLKYSIEVHYPLDTIRAHFLLAILNFLEPEKKLELSKKHLNYGIDASVRYGILKLMGNFYGLKALIAIYEKQNKNYILKIFETMVEYLKQEDLLFLGNLDFCYSNIILLTNYLIFQNNYGLENQKYQFLSKLTYYGYSTNCDYQCDIHKNCRYTCTQSTEMFQKNFENTKEGSLLLVNPRYKFPYIMDKYFFPIYL